MPTNVSASSTVDRGQETGTIRLASISLVKSTTMIVSKIQYAMCYSGMYENKGNLESVSNTTRRRGIEAGGDVHALKLLQCR